MNAIDDRNKGDIWLYDTPDGGQISNDGGSPIMTYGPETWAYLSLFGVIGSVDNWWANDILAEEQKLQGRFAEFIANNPPSTSNLRQAEEYAAQDLNSFITSGFCSDIEVSISLDSAKKITLRCFLLQSDQVIADFEFTDNWEYIRQNDPATRAR